MEKHQIDRIHTALRSSDEAEREKGLMLASVCLEHSHRSEDLCLALAEHLTSKDQSYREYASQGLFSANCTFPCLLDKLAVATRDPSEKVRENVVRTLAAFPVDNQVAEMLLPLLHDPGPLVAVEAAKGIWEHLQDADLIKPALVRGLRATDDYCLCMACQCVTEMGNCGAVFADRLCELVAHPTATVRANALYALKKTGYDRQRLADMAAPYRDDSDAALRYVAYKIMTEAGRDVG
jgi:hypothetical protein